MAEQSGKKLSPIQMQKYLKGSKYPASKDALVQRAQANRAPNDVIGKLKSLPGSEFESPATLMKALGQTE
jgi:Protein of unknown function (DUF2795)